jgi:hypothetical protein
VSHLTLLAAGVAALLACSRPRPSPEYDEARQRWTALVRERGDAAADDRRVEDVLGLLARVPPASADAASAAELRARIDAERKAGAEELLRRTRLVAGAAALPAMPAAGGVAASPASAPVEPRAPAATSLVLGMRLEEFRAQAGDCFETRGPIQVGSSDGGPPAAGEAWTLRDDAACQERYPGTSGKLVLFAQGALAGVALPSAARTVERRERVELGVLPDGGVGIRTDAGVVPAPPGAHIVPDQVGVLDGGGR